MPVSIDFAEVLDPAPLAFSILVLPVVPGVSHCSDYTLRCSVGIGIEFSVDLKLSIPHDSSPGYLALVDESPIIPFLNEARVKQILYQYPLSIRTHRLWVIPREICLRCRSYHLVVRVNLFRLEVHGDLTLFIGDRFQILLDVGVGDPEVGIRSHAVHLEFLADRADKRIERTREQACHGTLDLLIAYVIFVRVLDLLVLETFTRKEPDELARQLRGGDPVFRVERLNLESQELLIVK